jgi:hypothetical protein
MTDSYTRVEMDAKLETAAARTDTKFAELLGAIQTSNAEIGGKIDLLKSDIDGKIGAVQARVDMLPGKWTVFGTVMGTALGLAALVFAMIQYGGDTFATGISASQIADQAARQAVAEVLKK